jgi:hypothetical protein
MPYPKPKYRQNVELDEITINEVKSLLDLDGKVKSQTTLIPLCIRMNEIHKHYADPYYYTNWLPESWENFRYAMLQTFALDCDDVNISLVGGREKTLLVKLLEKKAKLHDKKYRIGV